jgi:argininosuccinate synthase
VLDLREEFGRDFVARAIRADAIYENRYPMGTALGRPLIAKRLVEIAAIEQATTIAHGGSRHDGRLGTALRAIAPELRVLAPVCDWQMSRADEVEYARRHGIPLPANVDTPCRAELNLWGRSIDCGALTDPWSEPPDDIFTLTRPPRDCPDEPAYVEIAFEQGVPTAINGVSMPLLELIASLRLIAGAHGVGRVDWVENRAADKKARELYEAPAAVLLHAAHKELQKLVTPKDLARFSRTVSLHYADLVYNGLWFSPLREALDAFVGKVQERVTGRVRLKLFKGGSSVVGRTAQPAAIGKPLVMAETKSR